MKIQLIILSILFCSTLADVPVVSVTQNGLVLRFESTEGFPEGYKIMDPLNNDITESCQLDTDYLDCTLTDSASSGTYTLVDTVNGNGEVDVFLAPVISTFSNPISPYASSNNPITINGAFFESGYTYSLVYGEYSVNLDLDSNIRLSVEDGFIGVGSNLITNVKKESNNDAIEGSQLSNSLTFNVNAPSITDYEFTDVTVGQTTIQGEADNLVLSTDSTVTLYALDGTQVQLTEYDKTSFNFDVAENFKFGHYNISVGGQFSEPFLFSQPEDTDSQFNVPTTVPVNGGNITIGGRFLNPLLSTGEVAKVSIFYAFGEKEAVEVVCVSTTTISPFNFTCAIPSGTNGFEYTLKYSSSIINFNGVAQTVGYSSPSITRVSSILFKTKGEVKIDGSNFANVSLEVTIGSSNCTVKSVTFNRIVCELDGQEEIPTGSTSLPVLISVDTLQSNNGSFVYGEPDSSQSQGGSNSEPNNSSILSINILLIFISIISINLIF